MPFVNGLMKKKGIGQLINYLYLNLGLEVTVHALDRIKELGFQYATKSGLSVGLDDMVIPDSKYTVVHEAEKQVIAMQQQYLDGSDHQRSSAPTRSRRCGPVSPSVLRMTCSTT
jgi:DNA-directed RNA polymerase subunit beta'